MFKNAILRHKWHALTFVCANIHCCYYNTFAISYLKDVLTAVLLNDQDEIFRVKILLVIAELVCLHGPAI